MAVMKEPWNDGRKCPTEQENREHQSRFVLKRRAELSYQPCCGDSKDSLQCPCLPFPCLVPEHEKGKRMEEIGKLCCTDEFMESCKGTSIKAFSK